MGCLLTVGRLPLPTLVIILVLDCGGAFIVALLLMIDMAVGAPKRLTRWVASLACVCVGVKGGIAPVVPVPTSPCAVNLCPYCPYCPYLTLQVRTAKTPLFSVLSLPVPTLTPFSPNSIGKFHALHGHFFHDVYPKIG